MEWTDLRRKLKQAQAERDERWGNCALHAIHRFMFQGGWLLIRKSKYQPYPHFIHADELPADLPASQFVPMNPGEGKPMRLFFRGFVMDKVGEVPPHRGFNWAMAIFALGSIGGWVAIGVLAFGIVKG